MPPKPVARRRPPAANDTQPSSTNGGSSSSSGANDVARSDIPSEAQQPAAPAQPVQQQASTATMTAKPARLETLNPSTLGTPSARGRPAIARPKFAGRRSQAVRAELEREQAEQKAKENAERARRIAKLSGRGRGRGNLPERGRGRGRGGYVGESDRVASVASGPFSAGQASGGGGWGRGSARTTTTSSGGMYFGGGTMEGSGIRAGSRSTMRMDSGGVKQEDGSGFDARVKTDGTADEGYISSDVEEGDKELARKDVDNLVVVDLTQDEDSYVQSYAPLRVPRQAHKERVVGINVDESASADATSKEDIKESNASVRKRGKQKTKDVEIVGEKERFHGTYSSSETEGDHIKEEQQDDDDDLPHAMDIPQAGTNLDAPSSPESRRKAKAQIKSRTESESKPVKPLLHTSEEAKEWDLQQKDLRMLRSELGTLASQSHDADGDITAMQSTTHLNDRRADKVYLFQFPPVLPHLSPVRVKPEPDGTDPEGPTLEGGAAPVPNMTVEPSADPAAETAAQRQTQLPAGAVGKLRVHRSGKATLDWGGTSLCIQMGTNISFLQDIVITDMLDAKEGQMNSDEIGGVAMGMGQVKGKFVVTPNWDELLS